MLALIMQAAITLYMAAGVVFFVGTRYRAGFTTWKSGLAAYLPGTVAAAIPFFDTLRQLA